MVIKMTERYLMGTKIKEGEVLAKVMVERDSRLMSPTEDERDKFFNFKIKITFDRIRYRSELEEMRVNLEGYLRQGKSWIKQLVNNSDMIPTLEKLKESGFEVFNNEKNRDYQKIVASVL